MYRKKLGLAIILIIALIGVYFTYFFYRVFFLPNTTFLNSTSYVFISSKATMDDLVTELTPLLKNVQDFKLAAEKKGYATRIRGGKYAIEQGMSNHEIINRLRGQSMPVRVTFNNQERIENLAGRLAAQLEVDSLSLVQQFLDPEFLEENEFTLENVLGMYIPNSYELFWNSTPAQIQNRMWKEYQRFWSNDRLAAAERQGLSPSEVISLAAIVQKETLKVEERPLIAGVYLNRLNKRMRLQADPTVVYAMRKSQDNFNLIIRRVLKKDLKISSPYNTYQVTGLPPGPIVMPDISSIEAVLYPKKHKYLYFVADPSRLGYHDFSTNLKEHNRKAKKYYRWLNKQKLYR